VSLADLSAWVCGGGRSVVALNAAAHACGVAGEWRPALQLLESMEKRLGLEPNVVREDGGEGGG